MSDTPEGNICRVSAELGWAADTLAVVDKALLKLSAEVKTLKRERDEAFGVLKEINHWINVAVMRPPTPNEAAYAINTWGDKIRPILEVTE